MIQYHVVISSYWILFNFERHTWWWNAHYGPKFLWFCCLINIIFFNSEKWVSCKTSGIFCEFNSLIHEKCGSDFKSIIFKLIIFYACCDIALSWMPPNLTNREVNSGSGNGLLLSGNKSCTWNNVGMVLSCLLVSLGHSELNASSILEHGVCGMHLQQQTSINLKK